MTCDMFYEASSKRENTSHENFFTLSLVFLTLFGYIKYIFSNACYHKKINWKKNLEEMFENVIWWCAKTFETKPQKFKRFFLDNIHSSGILNYLNFFLTTVPSCPDNQGIIGNECNGLGWDLNSAHWVPIPHR